MKFFIKIKTLHTLLLAVCFVVLLPMTTFAITANGMIAGTTLTWSLANNDTLTISGAGLIPDFISGTNAPWLPYSANIKNVVIEDNVTAIGDSAFTGCDSLISVIIGNGVGAIGNGAFIPCKNLVSFIVSENNINHASVDGVLFTADTIFLNRCPPGKTGDYVIPSTVQIINNSSFVFGSLTSVTIPAGVTGIGANAFKESQLTSVTCLAPTAPDITTDIFFACSPFALYVPDGVDYSDWITKLGSVISLIGRIPSGDGTTHPYEIENIVQLRWLSDNPSMWDKDFVQTADIDASATRTWNGGQGFSPIGKDSERFTGTYNGKGHIISRLYINSPSSKREVGLFGCIGNNARVDSLGLVNADVTGDGYVGVVVGWNFGVVSQCYSSGDVYCYDMQAGGVVGHNHNKVIDCYSSCRVNGDMYSGGVVAYNENATVTNCYAFGEVVHIGGNHGGVVGHRTGGSINYCFYDSITTGQHDADGRGTPKPTAELWKISTFTTWNFSGNPWTIRPDSSYPYFPWQSAPVYVNVFAGVASTLSINLLNNVDSVVIYDKNKVRGGGLATTSANPNITISGVLNDTIYIVTYEANKAPSYMVRAVSTPFCGGNGTAGSPFQICNAATLDKLHYFVGNAHQNTYCELTDDIDLTAFLQDSARGWLPIGGDGTAFCGHFNGRGHKITGLRVNRDMEYVGLFGYIDGGSIDSVGIEIAAGDSVYGKLAYVGGLAGYARGAAIADCYVMGSISGGYVNESDFVGGLVGSVAATSTISRCYTAGKVTGRGRIGGLVGTGANSTIEQCYSIASVSGNLLPNSYTGGLVGNAGSNVAITNSYAAGTVNGTGRVGGLTGSNMSGSVVTNSYAVGAVSGTADVGGLVGYNTAAAADFTTDYFNKETCGTAAAASTYGKPRTTAELAVPDTFASWNFTTIWKIDTALNYPYLAWQPAIREATVTDTSFAHKIYSGSVYTPQPVVMLGANTLVQGKDYTVRHLNNINASDTAAIVVVGAGIYGGGMKRTFTILPDTVTVTVRDTFKIYGTFLDPAIPYTVRDKNGNVVSVSGTLGREAGDTIGAYNITEGYGWVSGNYVFKFDITGKKFHILPDENANSNNDTITDITGAKYDAARQRWVINCGNTNGFVTITVNTENPATKVYFEGVEQHSKTFAMAMPLAGLDTFEYVLLLAANGKRDTIPFVLERQLENEIVGTLWNNVIYVNNNDDNNGGYTFTNYVWYRNGEVFPTPRGQYYSKGDRETDLLLAGNYQIELTTDDGKTLRTCVLNVEPQVVAELRVYPNAVANSKINVEDVDLRAGDAIIIYTIHGNLVHTYSAMGNTTSLTLPRLSPGIYIVKARGKRAKIVVQDN